MLLDLLYHSLPTAQKRRWHFDAFILHIISSLEQMRLSPSLGGEDEYSLLRLARDTVRASPILFLDEFQMPDRASAKLVSGLLVGCWGLGGVLVGSSNRRPAEMVMAAGAGREGEWDGFLEALGRRCEVWSMRGVQDWRRVRRKGWWKVGFGGAGQEVVEGEGETDCPEYYFHQDPDPADTEKRWNTALRTAINNASPTSVPPTSPIPWSPLTLTTFSRPLAIPHHLHGIAFLPFSSLCATPLGAADYLTLTRHIHTLFLHSVPSLTDKSEARRFITLLDAVYENGVRLALSSPAPLAGLLFPEQIPVKEKEKGSAGREWDMSGDSDALHAEVYAESELAGVFRPNVAVYDGDRRAEVGVAGGRGDVDYGKTVGLTGEDEKFAARRAVSRLWEVCGEGWWQGVEWRGCLIPPVQDAEEKSAVIREDRQVSVDRITAEHSGKVEHARDGVIFSPLRQHPDPPPKFGVEHFWSVVRWGRRAGNWGKGVEGVGERPEERGGEK